MARLLVSGAAERKGLEPPTVEGVDFGGGVGYNVGQEQRKKGTGNDEEGGGTDRRGGGRGRGVGAR